MRGILITAAVAIPLILSVMACGQERQSRQGDPSSPVSFKNDVTPIVKKHCLPCHAEENFNPSELSLDSYSSLMAGGKHGTPVVPGKADESLIVQKVGPHPPFGDQMPLKKKSAPTADRLSDQEVQTIKEWINQGAKDN